MLEIEQKFQVPDLTRLRRRIESAVAIESEQTLVQNDWYFSHPVRDFAETDEALRVRQTTMAADRSAATTWVTYKGPRLDRAGSGRQFKSRPEIELPVGSVPGDAEKMRTMLLSLGFGEAGAVHKTRQCLKTQWRGFSIEFALDDVRDLGQFAEIEIVTGPDQRQAAQQLIAELATQLGLVDPITRSYRDMLYS